MNVTQSTKIAAIHAAMKHGHEGLGALLDLASSTSVQRELHAAYRQLIGARVLDPKGPYERWGARVWSDADLNVLCPICDTPLKGNVQQTLYDCDLTIDLEPSIPGWTYETVDSPKDVESKLVELRCIECGLTLPGSAVKYSGEKEQDDEPA